MQRSARESVAHAEVSPEDVEAFDAFARESTRKRAETIGLMFVGVFGVAFVVGQYVVKTETHVVERTWLPAQFAASLASCFFLRYWSFSRRHPVAVAGFFQVIVACAGGRLLGELGGLDGPSFYGLYTLPALPMVLTCGLRARIGITSALVFPFLFGYFAPHPEYLQHPLIHIPVVYVISCFVIGIVIGHWIYNLTRDRFLFALRIEAQRAKLAEHNEALTEEVVAKSGAVAELSALIKTVRVDERSDLARTLHDDIGQLIVGARMELSNLELVLGGSGAKNSGELAFLYEIIESLSTSTRRIVGGLREADSTSLSESVDAILAPIRKRAGVDIRTRVSEDLDVSLPIREAICRTVQEGVTNVLKHANACTVEIDVAAEGQQVVATVSDDGHGFSDSRLASRESHGFGLLGVRERAEALGGRIEVESGTTGTRLRVLLPLPDNANAKSP
ncbi:MAG: signal transduction histidine kinase [Polyangiales bacterium]